MYKTLDSEYSFVQLVSTVVTRVRRRSHVVSSLCSVREVHTRTVGA
jgi:hypothetical protein